MKNLSVVFLLLLPIISRAQTGSDILLFDVTGKGAKMKIANPVNITNRAGYDNQPSFHVKKPLVYYSSFDANGRADIKFYNYQSKITTALTHTTEREYSPTLTPDGKFISCIIQRDNDAQDLGKYPLEGGDPTTLIDNLIVGYHSWIDEDNLLLFVLGEPQTLRWYNLTTHSDEIMANSIGRSLHKIPGQNAMSFVEKKSDDNWVINKLDISTKEITTLVPTLPGREDMTWTQLGIIIMSDGIKLFMCDPFGEKEWKEITIESGQEKLKGVTRLAMSKNGKKLAVVVSE